MTSQEDSTTGDVRVDAVVDRLDEFERLDPAAQLQAFGELHDALGAVLDAPAELAPPAT